MQPAVTGRSGRAFRPTVLLAAILGAALLFMAVSVSAPANVLAASTMWAACDGVNLRTSASTTSPVKVTLRRDTRVTVTTKVTGSRWTAECGGKVVSGNTWYRISGINGKSVTAPYGVTYLYAATGLFRGASGVAPSAAQTLMTACRVNLRTAASTRAPIKRTIGASTRVTVVGTVTGGSWRATCAGRNSRGNKWYRISAVGGRSVRSLYRVSYVYVATSLLKPVPVVRPPAPPAPPPPPAATTLYAQCDGINVRTSAAIAGEFRTRLTAGTPVSVVGTVEGGGWGTTCNGKEVSGNTWHKITAVDGKTATTFGVAYLYAAAGLFAETLPPPPPPPPPPGIPITEGIDVSHWQNQIDWAQVAAAGKKFAFIKASEDIDFVDWNYATNRAGAKAAGLLVGAYHFARPDLTPADGIAEADHFLNTAAVASGDLVPVLDLEKTGGLTQQQLQLWTMAFLGRVYERTGVRAMIYVSPSFWANNMGNTNWFAANGYPVVWIAHWGTTSPSVPGSDWGGHGWTFWQYTSDGAVPGIVGRVDLNRYKGTDFSPVRVP